MKSKFPVDVKQFAELFNCEESTAYGVLRFLAEKGLVETTKRPQPQGKKGKPATIFLVDIDETTRELGALLVKGFEKLAVSPAILATPAANDTIYPLKDEQIQATAPGDVVSLSLA